VLRLVAAREAEAPGALAERMCLHKSTVTGIVRRLERVGLIERDRHADDGRRVTLALTRAGRKLAASHPGTIEAAVARAIAMASPAELRAAGGFLKKLADALLEPVPSSTRPPRRTGRR
jgi:DNA-binding MarR family transcriptional regulator